MQLAQIHHYQSTIFTKKYNKILKLSPENVKIYNV